MRRRAAVALCLGLAVLLGGCAGSTNGTDAEAEAVRQAVRAYNDALVVGFAEMDMNALGAVATEEQATREYYLMAALGESRVRMLSALLDLRFDEVVFPDEGTARVLTTETWDYDHQSLDTSETVRSERGVVYRLQYDLVLQDGVWLVDAVTSLGGSPGETTVTP